MEALLPLTKIPCILLATIGLHITATPPHPPPSKSEEAPSTSLEFIVKQRAAPFVIKIICWFAASAEISLICAQTLGYDVQAKRFLSTLGIRTQPTHSINLYPSKSFYLGTCLAVLGGYIRYSCYRELGRLFTFEMSILKEHRLVTTGPYALVRHPAYTGVLCTVIGIALVHGTSGSWLKEYSALDSTFILIMAVIHFTMTALITTGLLKRIPMEDEALEENFGQQWRDWKEKVPYRLFWGIY